MTSPAGPGQTAGEGGAWQAWLDALGQETGVRLRVRAYEGDGGRDRQPGDWWRDGRRWCVHLAPGVYALLEEDTPEVVRRLLSFSIRQMGTVQPAWAERVQEAVHGLQKLSAADLLAAWQGDPLIAAPHLVPRTARFPAWFIWLDITDGMATEAHDEVRAAVEGFHPAGQVCWLPPSGPGGGLSALLWWPMPEPAEADRDEEEPDPGESASASAHPAESVIRRHAARLLQTLAADEMGAEASLGCRMDTPADAWRSLVTAVMARRQRQWLTDAARMRDGVSGWADEPWLWTAAGLPTAVREWLRRTAAEHAAGDVFANPDVAETLQGMIQADLNISEAARRLYLHRNTLINRIERIREATGYDLRRFRDASELWLLWLLQRTELGDPHNPAPEV
ncbi:MAG: helix-turn-helix domain-containing protein [Thermoflavifilum sp.]|nr:helix-turn-helix domain-containing protein [Thermoflavifilum sp.]MCL6514157.1 helix-turn-helix domain-containing protein [Alicyclobacillus sp.]